MEKRYYFFPVVIGPLEEGGFLASCPVLQGCRAEGESYGEVIENMQDVIKTHIEARKTYGEPIPEVSVPEKTDLRLTLPLPVSL